MNEWKIQMCSCTCLFLWCGCEKPSQRLCLNAWSPAGDCFRRWVLRLEVDCWGRLPSPSCVFHLPRLPTDIVIFLL